MDITISILATNEINSFSSFFNRLLSSEFPGYSPAVVKYLHNMYSSANFHYWLKNNYKTVFVAKEDDTFVGLAVVDEPYGGVCLLRWLAIDPHFQKKGIGRKLIQTWINYAKEKGCHKIEVAAQPEAKGFYEKMELNLEGKRDKSYFGIDQYIFGKVIGEPSDEVMTGY